MSYLIRISIKESNRAETERFVDFKLNDKIVARALFNVLCNTADKVEHANQKSSS